MKEIRNGKGSGYDNFNKICLAGTGMKRVFVRKTKKIVFDRINPFCSRYLRGTAGKEFF
jgi:hypothetical protein